MAEVGGGGWRWGGGGGGRPLVARTTSSRRASRQTNWIISFPCSPCPASSVHPAHPPPPPPLLPFSFFISLFVPPSLFFCFFFARTHFSPLFLYTFLFLSKRRSDQPLDDIRYLFLFPPSVLFSSLPFPSLPPSYFFFICLFPVPVLLCFYVPWFFLAYARPDAFKACSVN